MLARVALLVGGGLAIGMVVSLWASGLARALLHWIAASPPPHAGRGLASATIAINDRQLQHVVDAGLAPLLHYAARDELAMIPRHWHDVLKSAELTARFTHAALRDSAIRVVDTCRDAGVPVTLLKGISISDQHYPAPHLRPMGDIDVLLTRIEEL